MPANLDPLNRLRLARLGAEQLRKGGAGRGWKIVPKAGARLEK
ncbi:MAG: hypothetical protein WBB72_14045 [Methyloceanibacter sp.]